MKLKKNKLPWLIISIILLVGFIALSIYQLINSDFEPINLVMMIFIGDAIFNCFEEK